MNDGRMLMTDKLIYPIVLMILAMIPWNISFAQNEDSISNLLQAVKSGRITYKLSESEEPELSIIEDGPKELFNLTISELLDPKFLNKKIKCLSTSIKKRKKIRYFSKKLISV